MNIPNYFVLYSTINSVKDRKVSVIAILETVAMTIIGFWLLMTFGLWWHILVGLLISPMFYLRTKQSTFSSIEYTNKIYTYITSDKYINKKDRVYIISIRLILFLLCYLITYNILVYFNIENTEITSFIISLSGSFTIKLATGQTVDYYKLRKAIILLQQKRYYNYKKLSINSDEEDMIMSGTILPYHWGEDYIDDYETEPFKFHRCHKSKNKRNCFDKLKRSISNKIKYLVIDSLVSSVFVGIFITSILILIFLVFNFSELSIIELIITFLMLVPISITATTIGLAIHLALLFLIVRMLVGIYFLIMSPRLSILAIPYNWRSMIFSQDSMHPPELVPNSEASDFSNVTYSSLVGFFQQSNSFLEKSIVGIFLVILYIPAWLFRYTMKMGAWLWLPLIWLTQKPSEKIDDAVFLKDESTEFWANFRILYSLIILSVFTFLPLVLATELKSYNLEEHALGIIFLFGFTKIWTWVRAIVALLTIVIYFFTRHIRLYRDNNVEKYGIFWIQKLRQLSYLRTILSLFTLGVTLYLVTTEIIDWNLVFSSFKNMQYLP